MPFFIFCAITAAYHCAEAFAPHGRQDSLSLPYTPPLAQTEIVPFTCDPPPAAGPQNLLYNSVYKKNDPYHANVDRKAKKEYEEETADTQRFENLLVKMSNDYLRYRTPARAQCVLQWLYSWAQDNALLGETNDMGVAVRQWALASLASAFAQIRDEPSLDSRMKAKVRLWLRLCAKTVIKDYPTDATQMRKFNNHLYWASWAVTITGIATNSRELYDWGITRAKNVINNQFHDDGTLPLEMARGKKAFQYHIFAALPLIMLAEAAAHNGDDLYNLRDGILHRFVQLIVDNISHPDYFEALTGMHQIPASGLHEGHLAWMEAYQHRFPSPKMEKLLARHRPLFLRRTGGDMTYLYNY